MTFLPVVQRELCEAARRKSTYRIRVFAALAALALGSWIYLEESRWQVPGRMGRSIFGGVSGLTFGFCLLSGVFFTADCLSREKREGTLGLLFLTDLKGYDVGLGKLMATSVCALYGLVAIFPILAIPLLLGGVTGDDFWRMMLVLGNTLFLSLAVGMAISTVSRQERRSALATFIALIFLAAGFPLIAETYRHLKGLSAPPTALLLPSPGFTLRLAFSFGFGGFSELFWKSLLTVHLIAWACLTTSCILLPRVWQDRSVTTGLFGWRNFLQHWRYGWPVRRAAFRRLRLRINPFLWLVTRNRWRQVHLWAILAMTALAWLWGILMMTNRGNAPFGMFAMFLLHAIFKISVASEASYRFVEDRRSGALELLLPTPLTVREILRGQLHALHRQFAAPLVVVFFFDLFFLVSLLSSRTFRAQDRIEITITFFTMMMLMLFDFGALRWVGMWLGMTAKNSLMATLGAVIRIMVLPSSLFLLGMGMASLFRHQMRSPRFGTVLSFWIVLSLSIGLFYWLRAKHQLTRDFRALASQISRPRRGILPWRLFERKPAQMKPPVLVVRY